VAFRAIGERTNQIVWWLVSIGLFVGIWELTFAMGLYSARILPPPHIFLADIPNQLPAFDFGNINAGDTTASTPYQAVAETIMATVMRVVAGLGLGFILGVFSGSLIRYFHWFGKLMLPTVTLLAPISPFAWLPVAVYLFGTGNKPAIFLVFLAVYFIITLATIAEIDAVKGTYLNVAKIMGASQLQTYLQVILPAVLPGLFMILRLNLFAAWMIVLIAESAGSDSGLGALVMLARNTGATNLVMIGMVVIGAVGFAFDVVLRFVQRRALYWVPEVQASLQK
jgi:NitT/TauT family transport system permease protein